MEVSGKLTASLKRSDVCGVPWLQQIFEHLHLHNAHLVNESDRAAGVLAPAFLDGARLQLVRAVLLDTPARKGLLRAQGPLSTYSARVDLANALGLTSDETGSDLVLLGTIRNKFAHY